MSKIKNIEISQRPREKALLNGIKSLSTKELLALIIRCGTKDVSAIEIAELLLSSYGSLSNLLNSDIYGLMKIKGIKKAKAIEIMAILELTKRISSESNKNILSIREAEDVYKIFRMELENEQQEHFVVLFLNVKLIIIKKETLFVGGETSSLIDVNLLFKKALICGARKIICIHNHPSGDPTPSSEDIKLTTKIRKICEIVKIDLLDHIIIGRNNYFSFAKMGI